MSAHNQRYQPSIEDKRAGNRRAESYLRTYCSMLVASSPEVVTAITLSIRANEFGVSPGHWRDIALCMAKDYSLDVDISIREDRMRIRFTREASPKDNGS